MNTRVAIASCVSFFLFVSHAFAVITFTPLSEFLVADADVHVNGISGDGSTIVGAYRLGGTYREAFRWDQRRGFVTLGDLPGGNVVSDAYAASVDGKVIVGGGHTASFGEPFRWSEASGMTSIGTLPGPNSWNEAYGVSADGTVIVGESQGHLAFRWTETTGILSIGDLPGGDRYSRASAISADGTIVVGGSRGLAGDEAFRWTAESGMVGLGDLPGGDYYSEANAISADGSAVVGTSSSSKSGASGRVFTEAFHWNTIKGMTGIGLLRNARSSVAYDISGDGTVIVGESGSEAFIWDATNGMRSLTEVLKSAGIDLTGWSLISAVGISDDGQIIVGNGRDLETGRIRPWKIDLDAPVVPEPGTLPIMLIGLSAASLASRNASRTMRRDSSSLRKSGTVHDPR